MLNVRLYEDFRSMMENEGRAEEVLERFFNDMVEEQNFDLSFYQWCRKNLYYNTIGDFYICADENLRDQKGKLEELIVSNGYSIYDIELKKIEQIITIENELEELIDGLTDEEIEEVLEIKNFLHKL
ncbi:Uncharacterised protein [Fusobacterium necrogenes]|uniref:Uncharacterized protein n=1 Tax=Fusobacterium necrogenes TaxID=858 RepID=A0A377GQ16_9FUSO|nr:hypothetical protein [Fusobacterium necrogenes]STO28754.1 Uncharacterised protein [Fusobacterium necrogenes]